MRIEAQNICVDINGKSILRDISIAVESGALVGLIGPNGAGKSNLLRVLANLLAPTAGTVRYDNRTIAEIGRAELARRISFLAQGGEVHWEMRVEALVALGRLPHRRPFANRSYADDEAIERAMTVTDSLSFRDRTTSSLSGGERMRVLLARTLAVEADILLADEPLAALDPLHQLEAMTLLQTIARRGTGIVVILHDLMLAARFCDRLVLLNEGQVIADDTPDSVLSDAHTAEAFGVTVARGAHDGQSFIIPWQPIASRTDAL